MTDLSRREFLVVGGMALVGFGFAPDRRAPATALEVIEMRSDVAGSRVWFDPIGLLVVPGTTIRWIVRQNVHTTTAYHPRNDNHPLRIPDGAVPWDSGFLVNPGDHFDVTLTVPGVYDYYCMPHEAAGMVGRIIVGKPLGPGSEPFDYWAGRPGTEEWHHVPDAARKTFPSVARILAEHRVHPAEPAR
ncbi:MAG TPA: plastocyanin/azurin family copper-binding protein [Gemmatimonadaceae bacterium]|nr:plastocyanin/azurin family copper-binding protein [Gemmatimonadaceae bacterium]